MTHIFCWRQHFLPIYFCLVTGKWTDDVIMTSQHQIITKRSDVIYFINILFVCKFEVIWIMRTEVFYKTIYEDLLSGYLKILTGYSHIPSTSEYILTFFG